MDFLETSKLLEFGKDLLLVLIGAVIGIFAALVQSKFDRKREAAGKLRAAFAPELARIDHLKQSDVEAFLQEAFQRHSVAIEEFRPFVPSGKQQAYEQAWRNYFQVGGSVRFHDYYFGEGCTDKFRERVSAILKFASP